MQIYDVLVPEEYDYQGETRTKFHNVGTAFERKDGKPGFTLQIPPGIALTGRVLVQPRKPKDDGQAG